MQLSELIDAWMRQRKIPVRELARQIGMDHTTLHRFRHGEECSNHNLVRILLWALSPKKP